MPSLLERFANEEGEDEERSGMEGMEWSAFNEYERGFVAEQRRSHGVGEVQRGWKVTQRSKSDASSVYFRPGAGATVPYLVYARFRMCIIGRW